VRAIVLRSPKTLDHPHSSPSFLSFRTEYSCLVSKILSFISPSPALVILYIFHSIPTTIHGARMSSTFPSLLYPTRPHSLCLLLCFASHPLLPGAEEAGAMAGPHSGGEEAGGAPPAGCSLLFYKRGRARDPGHELLLLPVHLFSPSLSAMAAMAMSRRWRSRGGGARRWGSRQRGGGAAVVAR
jgi:hypothetical protein